ncbi:MAG: FAD-binding oxidoreductase [SAR202 cluster bacterium]|nr:FAD-binding oxidoreductase [SAR202 cluster bacterium]
MRKTAEAVIIGGGCIGISTLYYLSKLGMDNVVLLEKGSLASGSTGDSAAIVRQHYSNEVSIRLVMKSIEILRSFPEEFGPEVFNPIGWIFLVPPSVENSFASNMHRLQKLGVRTWEVSPQKVAQEHISGLVLDGISKAAYEPDSGYADPHSTVLGFADRAKDLGSEIYVNTPAIGIVMSGDKITGVKTHDGQISTPRVVNAAGPWAQEIAKWVGLDLPLEVSREQEMMLRISPNGSSLERSVSNMVDQTYFRPTVDPSTILVGVGHPKKNELVDPDSYNTHADNAFLDDVSNRIIRRIPKFSESEIISSWAGLYTITPDWNMIIDKVHGIEDLYIAVGGSGHSFKLSPAIGQCLAELIINGEASTVDITSLRAGRFDDNTKLKSTYGGNRG